MKRRMISAILLASMLFASCGGGSVSTDTTASDTTTAPTAEETTSSRISDNLPAKDFGGKGFDILTTEWYNAPAYIYAESQNGDVMNDALWKSVTSVEERFNVDITCETEPGTQELATRIHSMVLAGEDEYEFVFGHDLLTVGNAVKGDFLDIHSLPNIDFSKPWWNGSSETFTVGGKLLFTSNPISIGGIFMNYILTYNKALAEDYAIEIPHDDVVAGEWYIDDLTELIKDFPQDLNGDSEMTEEDLYGFVTSYYGHMGMQSDLEGGLLEKDKDGNLVIVENTERIVGIMEKVEALLSHGTDAYGKSNEFGIELFRENKALFMFGESRVLYDNRDSEVVYGILPFPKYDENQESYRSSGCDLYWAIPTLASGEADMIGCVVEALSCNGYNDVAPQVWELVLGRKLADSEEDTAMFNIIRDIQYVDVGYAFSGQAATLTDLIFMTEKTTSGEAISYIEGRRKSVLSQIESLNAALAELG